MRKNISIAIISLFICCTNIVKGAVHVENHVFAERDSLLRMDVYLPDNAMDTVRPCIIFVFGGGFITGAKDEPDNVSYCRALADRGYVTVAIDYRLGMKGVTNVGVFNYKPLDKSIQMAVEDLYAATNYVLQQADRWRINPQLIIISGSSAGAITVLQADYELSNRRSIADVLPDDFRYAGVISFAGAIFSHEGKPDYRFNPAPTLFFHGTKDQLVPYNKIQFGNLGFFGSNALAVQFKKYGFPYYIYRYETREHDIASVPMQHNLEDITNFIRDYVVEKYPLQKDLSIKDARLKPLTKTWKRKDLYNSKEQ